MLVRRQAVRWPVKSSNTGLTLIEGLIVVFLIGIFSAIAAPSWLSFMNHQRLRAASERVYWAIRTAQSNAKRDKVEWQATFRVQDDLVQIAVHPSVLPAGQTLNDFPSSQSGTFSSSTWYSLDRKITLDLDHTTFTRVDAQNIKTQKGTFRRALFNYKGCPLMDIDQECGPGGLGKLTISHADLGQKRKRCTIVSTLIGGMRTAEDNKCK